MFEKLPQRKDVIIMSNEYFLNAKKRYKTIEQTKRHINSDFKNGDKAVKFLCIALLELHNKEGSGSIDDILDFLDERMEVLAK